jgi:hypothetical protein
MPSLGEDSPRQAQIMQSEHPDYSFNGSDSPSFGIPDVSSLSLVCSFGGISERKSRENLQECAAAESNFFTTPRSPSGTKSKCRHNPSSNDFALNDPTHLRYNNSFEPAKRRLSAAPFLPMTSDLEAPLPAFYPVPGQCLRSNTTKTNKRRGISYSGKIMNYHQVHRNTRSSQIVYMEDDIEHLPDSRRGKLFLSDLDDDETTNSSYIPKISIRVSKVA